jgi:hypothetical protein
MNCLRYPFVLSILLSTTSVNALEMPIVGWSTSDSYHAFAAFDQSGTDNHMYHTGEDMDGVIGETQVITGINGSVVSIFGLGPVECTDDNQNTYSGERVYMVDYADLAETTLEKCDPDSVSACDADNDPECDSGCRYFCTGNPGQEADGKSINHGYGITVIIQDSDNPGQYNLYAHLAAINNEMWEAYQNDGAYNVTPQTPLGLVGASSGSTWDYRPTMGDHLHYEVRDFLSLKNPYGTYYGYTPDLPLGDSYFDPRYLSFQQPDPVYLANATVLKIIGNEGGCAYDGCSEEYGLRIYSGPGINHSVLGWTGKEQILVSDLYKKSNTEGDNIENRTWYRISLPSQGIIVPVYGWIASESKPDGDGETTAYIEETSSTPLFTVTNAEPGVGWPLVIDYNLTDADPKNDCEEEVTTLEGNNCIRVWDNSINSYLSVKIQNGQYLAVVPNETVIDTEKYEPIEGPGGRLWYEVYIPALYFKDPVNNDCPTDLPDDQCQGDYLTAWLPSNALYQSSDAISANIDTVLMIDSSGSMVDNDPLDKRLDAAEAYLTASIDGDYVGVVDFDYYARLASPLVRLPENKELLEDAIATIDSSGGTNIGAGVQMGCDALLDSPSDNNVRAGILLTDGVGTYGTEHECFSMNDWPIFTFAMGDADVDLLQTIAESTGGEFKELPATDLVCEFLIVRSKIAGSTPGPCTTWHIGPLEIVRFFANVPSDQENASWAISWSGSDVELSLQTPSGRVINRETIAEDVTHDKGEAFEIYSVSNPEPGEWEVKLYGLDVPPEGEDVVFSFTSIPMAVKEIDIDVKPDTKINVINIGSRGVFPVALFGDEEFDVIEIDQSTLTLSGASPIAKGKSGRIGEFEDVNLDGYLDLVVSFSTVDLVLLESDKLSENEYIVELNGQTLGDLSIRGTDTIRLTP